MRLIDADKLIEEMDDRYKEKANNVPDNLAEGFMQMEKLIKEQPTAFDVDKVVEQLKNKKFSAFMTFANTGNEYLDMVYEDIGNYIDEAIDIVKDGGISD